MIEDHFKISITGASPNSSVVVTSTYNGHPGPGSPWTAGTTDASGAFVLTGTESTPYIGEWTEQWSVRGVNVGGLLDFEVIDKPASLSVLSVAVVAFNIPCGATYLGVFGDVGYQIYGSTTHTMAANYLYLEPWESLTDSNGKFLKENAIGPVPGFPNSSQFASDAGVFHDVPLGACAAPTAAPFTEIFTGKQAISMYIGSNDYPVRTNSWYASSTGLGHGKYSNRGDISISR